MKKLLYILGSFLFLGLMGCEEDLGQLGELTPPTNLTVTANVSADGSGLVDFNASAENAQTYHFYFGLSESESATLVPSGQLTYAYRGTGTYLVRVVAFGEGGLSSSATTEIDVQVDFKLPTEVRQTLTNGGSRTWLWKKSIPAHLGVGPEFYDDGSVGDAPVWYQAAPFEKEGEGCLYSDEIIFTENADGSIQMQLNNGGVTYFHIDEAADALGVSRPEGDQCFEYNIGEGISLVSFFETGSGISGSTGIGMELSDNGFMSYYVGTSTYEILSISEEAFEVRVVQDVDGNKLAWYHTFVAADFDGGDGGGEPKEYELVWDEEFTTNGAPSSDNWSYDIGTGNGGWGNGERQFYTDRLDNSVVEDGILKIIAKRESFGGEAFTSARLITKDKFEFTHGKVEIRAKLPAGSGTWPAFWLLGADIDDVSWPACGEIDIMEHVGNNEGRVQAALHSPSSFGNTENVGSTEIPNATSEFHVYEVEWTEDGIEFSVDGNSYYVYNPEVKDDSTYPFNKDFFLILNIAMGGTLGGEIAQEFTEATMEIDYVKVYQKQ